MNFEEERNEKWEKTRKCRYYHPSLDGTKSCVFGAKTLGDYSKYAREINPADCENCSKFKSRYIEYPLTINGIEYGSMEPWNVKPCLCRVRPCGDEKTYFGLYLGEFPRMPYSSFNEESGMLKFGVSGNPCIYVPELGKVVWGDESWWSRMDREEELKEITNETIDGQFYVQMLKALCRKGEDNVQNENNGSGQGY